MTRAELIMEELEDKARIYTNLPVAERLLWMKLFERLDELEAEIAKVREEIK